MEQKPRHSQYFEGVLQLRNLKNEAIEYVRFLIKENKVTIAKEINEKSGIDLYLSSKKFLHQLAKRLKSEFREGELKVNPKLFSEKDGKYIYRLTVLFRMPEFKKGDVLRYKGKVFRVERIGNDVSGSDILTKEKVRVKMALLLKNYRFIAKEGEEIPELD